MTRTLGKILYVSSCECFLFRFSVATLCTIYCLTDYIILTFLTEKLLTLTVREMLKTLKAMWHIFSLHLKQNKDFPRVGQAVAQVMPSGKFLVFYLGGTRLESLPGHRTCSLRIVIDFQRCRNFRLPQSRPWLLHCLSSLFYYPAIILTLGCM